MFWWICLIAILQSDLDRILPTFVLIISEDMELLSSRQIQMKDIENSYKFQHIVQGNCISFIIYIHISCQSVIEDIRIPVL